MELTMGVMTRGFINIKLRLFNIKEILKSAGEKKSYRGYAEKSFTEIVY